MAATKGRDGVVRGDGRDVVNGERFRQRGGAKSWGPREWGAYRRGYESGLRLGQRDGIETARVPPRSDRLMRLPDVMAATGLARTSLWDLERAGKFPRRMKRTEGSRVVVWSAAEVEQWVAERKATRMGPRTSGAGSQRARVAQG